MNPTTRSTAPGSRRRRFMTAGVVAAGLSLAGGGAAMAGDEAPAPAEVSTTPEAEAPTPVTTPSDELTPAPDPAASTPAPAPAPASEPAPTPASVPAPAPAEALPGGYTQERADAFWGAGYGWADVEALTALWQVDYAEAKARAGQMLIDGLPVPVAPTGPDEYFELDPNSPEAILLTAQLTAFWDAGYTGEDVDALSILWNSDFMETKARAGQMLIDGQVLPIAPASTPATS